MARGPVSSSSAGSRERSRLNPEVLASVSAVSKSFPGVVALNDVDFVVCSGEVNALVGENGAGKSTLIKLMAGIYAPDQGNIVVGEKQLVASPTSAHQAGIATIHQDHNLVPGMSVAENIVLGRWPTRFGVISKTAISGAIARGVGPGRAGNSRQTLRHADFRLRKASSLRWRAPSPRNPAS